MKYNWGVKIKLENPVKKTTKHTTQLTSAINNQRIFLAQRCLTLFNELHFNDFFGLII